MKKHCPDAAEFVKNNRMIMKKYMLILFGITFALMACQNNSKDDQSKVTEEKSSQVEISETNEPDNSTEDENPDLLETKTLSAASYETVKAEQISIGDKLAGMTVKSIDFVPGEKFEIAFEGKVDLIGHIYFNPHEYRMEFSSDNPVAYVEIDGSEHGLLEYLYLSNEEMVKSLFSDNQLQTYDEGLPVKFEIKVKNPTYTIYFSDKGRQAYGHAKAIV